MLLVFTSHKNTFSQAVKEIGVLWTFGFVLQVVHFSGIKPLSANFTKCSNTLKQFVCNLPTNCLSVFDDFVGLALKELI